MRLVDRVRREGQREGVAAHVGVEGYFPSVVCAPRFENSTPHTTPWGVWLIMTWPQRGMHDDDVAAA